MNKAEASRVVVAGATGDLGYRIAAALVECGAQVTALVRPGTEASRLARLHTKAISIEAVALDDAAGLRTVLTGAVCVVSALNGLEPVILGQQGHLLDAAVAAGVPRFILSDFCLDYTQTRFGDNRNMDLRRRFKAGLDVAPLAATSIFNGGFLELLDGSAPIVVPGRRVLYFGDPQQALDFTAKDDVAAFTAAAALDPDAPRVLRIAGDSLSPADMARTLTALTGQHYRTLRAGGISVLSGIINVARAVTPKSDEPFPAWQGMQYLRDMMSGRGKLQGLDNDRYGARPWQSARDVFKRFYR